MKFLERAFDNENQTWKYILVIFVGFWTSMTGYLTIGIVFGITSVLDDGIEVAIGAHSINNILSSIFVTSKSLALQTPALLFQKEVHPQKENWILLILSILFIVILTYKNNWKFRKLFEPLQKSEALGA